MPKKRIIVFDDKDDVLALLKDSLTSFNFDVSTWNKSENALREIKAFNPDLIILDLLMPNLGGFEICEMLNNDIQTRQIPIIIISGLGDPVDVKKSYELGAVGYFIKPFALGDLLKEIGKAIKNKENSL